jgi:hypothetical protein
VFRAWMHYLGYRSCKYDFVTKTSILLHWTQNDYLQCFGVFQKPWENKTMQNLCFGSECTIFWHQSYKDRFVTKASILLQWIQNHWECFGAFQKPSEWKKMQSTQNDDWDIFGAFCNPLECKKMRNLCFNPKCTISRYRSCDAFMILY